MLVKNEEDIIESTLRDAVKWSDKIIVMDNGSNDSTWEIVNSLAVEHPQIIPFAKDSQPFRIGLRAILFNQFKDELTSDDWWCIRMDADEFYFDNPKDFLKDIPLKYKLVYKASIDFCLTIEDVNEYQFSGNFAKDKSKIKYYQPYTWSEVRFLRHSNKLKWSVDKFLPSPVGLTFPKQIKVLHYQFRSPKQMENRLLVRKKAKEENCKSFKHEKGTEWQSYLKLRKDLVYYNDKDFQLLGNRNKFNKLHKRIFKELLTLLNYY